MGAKSLEAAFLKHGGGGSMMNKNREPGFSPVFGTPYRSPTGRLPREPDPYRAFFNSLNRRTMAPALDAIAQTDYAQIELRTLAYMALPEMEAQAIQHAARAGTGAELQAAWERIEWWLASNDQIARKDGVRRMFLMCIMYGAGPNTARESVINILKQGAEL